jgi:hypothetical protein
MFAVATGWRAPPGRGVAVSALVGMCCAAAVNVPIYFIGRWIGNPALQSNVLNVIKFVSGLMNSAIDTVGPLPLLILTVVCLIAAFYYLRLWHDTVKEFRPLSTEQKKLMALLAAVEPAKPTAKLKHTNKSKPFHLNTTREERLEWFTNTPPWDRLAPAVIDTILDGITDKVLLEVFVITSMEYDLVPRYEPLGRADDGSNVIRAQISQILCHLENRAVPRFAQAHKADKREEAVKAFGLVNDVFELAITLEKTQVIAYAQLATVWGIAGKREKCQDYAERGLAELEELRRRHRGIPVHKSSFLTEITDGLDQVEQRLRFYLEN